MCREEIQANTKGIQIEQLPGLCSLDIRFVFDVSQKNSLNTSCFVLNTDVHPGIFLVELQRHLQRLLACNYIWDIGKSSRCAKHNRTELQLRLRSVWQKTICEAAGNVVAVLRAEAMEDLHLRTTASPTLGKDDERIETFKEKSSERVDQIKDLQGQYVQARTLAAARSSVSLRSAPMRPNPASWRPSTADNIGGVIPGFIMTKEEHDKRAMRLKSVTPLRPIPQSETNEQTFDGFTVPLKSCLKPTEAHGSRKEGRIRALLQLWAICRKDKDKQSLDFE